MVRYGYMEQPDIRRALKDLQNRKMIHIAAERWIIEVGEEDIIADPSLTGLQRLMSHFVQLDSASFNSGS